MLVVTVISSRPPTQQNIGPLELRSAKECFKRIVLPSNSTPKETAGEESSVVVVANCPNCPTPKRVVDPHEGQIDPRVCKVLSQTGHLSCSLSRTTESRTSPITGSAGGGVRASFTFE